MYLQTVSEVFDLQATLQTRLGSLLPTGTNVDKTDDAQAKLDNALATVYDYIHANNLTGVETTALKLSQLLQGGFELSQQKVEGNAAIGGSGSGSTGASHPVLSPEEGAEGLARRPELPPDVGKRCEGTVGDWCGGYIMQEPIPFKVSATSHAPPPPPPPAATTLKEQACKHSAMQKPIL